MRSRLVRLCGLLIMLVATTIGCGDDPGPEVPVVGTITINPEPDSADATWQIAGPNDFARSGAGNATITDMAAGDYTLNWEAVAGWTAPSPATVTQTLAEGGTLTFMGTYVTPGLPGTITINPEPSSINAQWQIAGPGGFSQSGAGDLTLTNMTAGDYTVAWLAVSDWTAPNPAAVTRALTAGGTLMFTGTYVENGGIPAGFVSISAGDFTMGSPADELGRYSNETQHQVTLTHGIYVQSTEVTNQQYRDMAQWAYDNGYVTATASGLYDNLDGSTQILKRLGGGYYEITFSAGVFSCIKPTHPVKYMTWYGSVAYCDWLSLQQGLPRTYNHSTGECNTGNPYRAPGYRLPTEAEWEYVCRAGTQTPFNTGSCLDAGTEANYYGPAPYTGCPTGPYVGWTEPVGSYPANALGLYDMHGNLWEWCNDWYGAYGEIVTDPVGAGADGVRVIRGGSWISVARYCRAALRRGFDPSSVSYNLGFRVVRSSAP